MKDLYTYIDSLSRMSKPSCYFSKLLIAVGLFLMAALAWHSLIDRPSADELEKRDKVFLREVIESISEQDVRRILTQYDKSSEVKLSLFSSCADSKSCVTHVEMIFEGAISQVPSAIIRVNARMKSTIDIPCSIKNLSRYWQLELDELHWDIRVNTTSHAYKPISNSGKLKGANFIYKNGNNDAATSIVKAIALGLQRGSNSSH